MLAKKIKFQAGSLKLNMVSSILSTLVGLSVAFFLTPYLIRNIGKDVYSFFPLANNFVSYFTIIVNALNALASRFITISIVKKEHDKAQEYYSSVFWGNIILALIFLIPMIIIIIFLPYILNIPTGHVEEIEFLFILIFLSLIVNMITNVYAATTFVTNRLDLRSGQQIFISCLRVGLYLVLFIFLKPNIIFTGIVTLSESIANFLISFFWTKKLLPSYKPRIQFAKLKSIKEIVISGLWNSVNSLGSNLLTGMMLLLSNMVIGATASGNLSIVLTMVNLCTTLLSMVVNVFYPRQTRVYATDGIRGLVNETISSQYIMGCITAVPIIGLIVFGREFFSLWVPSEDSYQLQQLSIICLVPYLVQTCMWSLTQCYSVLNRLKKPSLIMLSLGVTNIIFTIIGCQLNSNQIYVIAVIPTILSLIYCLAFIPRDVAKETKVKSVVFYRPILSSFIGYLICFACFEAIHFVSNINSWASLVLWCAVAGALGYLIVFGLYKLNMKIGNNK